jgi:hypothetical protein
MELKGGITGPGVSVRFDVFPLELLDFRGKILQPVKRRKNDATTIPKKRFR